MKQLSFLPPFLPSFPFSLPSSLFLSLLFLLLAFNLCLRFFPVLASLFLFFLNSEHLLFVNKKKRKPQFSPV